MALSHYQTYAAGVTGTQPSLNLDPSIAPFTVTVAVAILNSGTGSFGLQISFDDQTVADASATWYADTAIPTGTVANKFAGYTIPMTRIRLVIVTNSAGLQLTTLQPFTIN